MKRICLISVFILASFCMYSQKNLSIGDKIPLFKATADDGSTWDISKYIGKDYIIVYFSPAAPLLQRPADVRSWQVLTEITRAI